MSQPEVRGRAPVRLAVGVLAALAMAVPAVSAASASASPAARAAGRHHISTPATGLAAGFLPLFTGPHRHSAAALAPANSHLTYYGGRVISSVQVVQVLYGAGTYTPEVQTTAAPSIASFYGGITNSSYFDWLNEYNTTITASNGQQGTNQAIGRGAFAQQVQITPAAANNGSTIDDVNIQAELKAQIAAGHLPAPTANTYYALYFPAGKVITQGGQTSGVQFCAFHGTTSSPETYYGVLPDFTSAGMSQGCGNGSRFQNETSVSSHELVEATTDAEVGLATNNAPPLAWYDPNNGEIGDICNGQQQTITGGDGAAYTVQKEWSNRQGACVAAAAVAANDFSLSLSPTSLTVAPGGSGTSTASTTVVSGSAGTVSLSSSGAPAGVTVTASPSSVTAGASSTITVAAAGSAAAGTYSITVTGTEGSATHSATLALTISGGGGGGGAGVTNGGFESGSLSGWTASGSASVVSSGAQSGTYAARVGSTSPSTDSSIAQTFTVPSGGTGVQFFYDVICPDSVTYDWATATLKDNTAGTTSTPLGHTCINPSSGWNAVTAAVTAGHSYTLTLASHDDNYAGDPTYTLYDSVSITTGGSGGGGGGGGGGGVVNGGFETGTLSGWTAAGAHDAVSTTHHSGAYAAMLGNTTATNGDSTLAQTFTVPAGSSALSLYYANKCPDTVTYDWVTVTLKDNTGGTTSTVVARTCSSSFAWTLARASVVAGHSYTLTLTSHDDNYGADPTYTLFDDIGLS